MAGSLGYAQRLSHREDLGGTLGAPELRDEGPASACPRVQALIAAVRAAGKVVVHTGAGISTAAGVPDFRGPEGIWTAQQQGKPLPSASCPFDRARPTLTHQALLALHRAGKLTYLVSCNVDSLHLRGGFPRAHLAELHGNCFAERCEACGAEVVRDFEQRTVGFKLTGRVCGVCGGRMRDQVLDWESALPVAELRAAERHGDEADLAIALGTSLIIVPAADLPQRTVRKGGQLAIVNLQATPKDKLAAKSGLLLRRPVDEVMRALCAGLSLAIPPYVRTDALRCSHIAGNTARNGGQAFTLVLHSRHGERCPVPWLAGVTLSFAGGRARPLAKGRVAEEADARHAALTDAPAWRLAGLPPWRLRCTTLGLDDPAQSLSVALRLHLGEGCSEPYADAMYRLDLATPPPLAAAGELLEVTTVRMSYDEPAGEEGGGKRVRTA